MQLRKEICFRFLTHIFKKTDQSHLCFLFFVLNCGMESSLPHNEQYEELIDFVRNLHNQLNDFDKLAPALAEKSSDLELNEKVIKYFKTEYYAHQRKDGMTKIGLGSLIILAGFCITCFNFHSNESFNFAMYGLTSIGICVVFWGFNKIIG